MMNPKEQAQSALTIMKEAIIAYSNHPEGVFASDVARELGLESDFEGNQRNYLSWSVIGLLVSETACAIRGKGIVADTSVREKVIAHSLSRDEIEKLTILRNERIADRDTAEALPDSSSCKNTQ
jgi:hypothetical protein